MSRPNYIICAILFLIFPLNSFSQPNVSKPKITGQLPSPLITSENTPITIGLNNLIVTDQDPIPVYPNGFTLTVSNGKDYKVQGRTVIPDNKFSGRLNVSVRVSDGKNNSDKFDVKIDVVKSQNAAPKITDQHPLSINQGQTLTISLLHLIVSDPDNNYPAEFTLKVYAGNNYTLNGNTIVTESNFKGNLKVPVTVNDGKSESNKFDLKIEVKQVQNTAPQITGQVPLSSGKGIPLSLSLTDLTVLDPDNVYPADFTLKISNGSNYSVQGNIISPSPSFAGTLTVGVVVNDGKSNSPVFPLKIDVEAAVSNVPPIITGQKQISLTQNTSLMLQLGHLLVSDPDNTYPNGFVLKVFPGNEYTLSGNTITPKPGFGGNLLSITVRVNDGIDDSPPFDLKVQIIPISSKPRINGQKELATKEDMTIQITLADLMVTDADNPGYPQGFILTVLDGDPDTYTVTRNAITPALNLNGFIEANVTVSDGKNTSDVFKLLILVQPVNDSPEILDPKPGVTRYEPGKAPLALYEFLEVRDVDSDFLSMAEVGFRELNHNPDNDQLLVVFDTSFSSIRPIYDQDGILFLIGYASKDEYQTALRSIHYSYNITKNESGLPMEIVSGPRTIYMTVTDGESVSSVYERQVNIETSISIGIPNAFTPNGDHSNDTWHLDVKNKAQMKTSHIKVYGKRGEVLFDSTGFENEWDGTYNGHILPVDTYYYTIEIHLPYTRKTFSGVVTILH